MTAIHLIVQYVLRQMMDTCADVDKDFMTFLLTKARNLADCAKLVSLLLRMIN